jgi:hypothetical protein
MLMAAIKMEILMRLEKLVDAISSNTQVRDSLLSVLREITRLIDPNNGSPNQVLPPLVEPRPKREMSKAEQILLNRLIRTTIDTIRQFAWDENQSIVKPSFTNETYKDSSMQSLAQIISSRYVNTTQGARFDEDEWYTAMEAALATASPFKTTALEILRKALALRIP